ncbi:hypothetical protein EGK76_01540 [Luteimonas sp. 100069]|nr:hypothetical protein EGK76_01540 [Luteimonas sp. 100069]
MDGTMDRSQMEDFIANAALLAAHLTQQCERAAAEQRDAAGALHGAAMDIEQRLAAGREAMLHATGAAVRDALTRQLDATTTRTDAAATRLERATESLGHLHAGLHARTRLLGGGALLALALAAVGIIGATAHLAELNLERAERASVRADVLEALQRVAIASCDSRPCIKLEAGLERWPSNEDYVYVDTRGSAQ